MALKIAKHDVIPIDDNLIMMSNHETVLLGAERVHVGISTGELELKTDPITGAKYKTDKIVAKEIYNLSTLSHLPFFVLDLETGGRGWFPGAFHIGDVRDYNVEVKVEMDMESETAFIISDETVEILDEGYDKNKELWYNIKFRDNTGYIKGSYVSNIRYI